MLKIYVVDDCFFVCYKNGEVLSNSRRHDISEISNYKIKKISSIIEFDSYYRLNMNPSLVQFNSILIIYKCLHKL
jgi:hypothetical protein